MISPLCIISLSVSCPRIVKHTSRDPSTTMGSSWKYLCITFQYCAVMYPTFSPLALQTSGCSVVLQTRCKRVALPALDLPMTRTLKWPIRSKCFLMIAGSMWSIVSSTPGGVSHYAANVLGPVHDVGHEHSPALEPALHCSVFLMSAESMWSISSAPVEELVAILVMYAIQAMILDTSTHLHWRPAAHSC